MAGNNSSNYQVGVRLGLDLIPYTSGLKAAGYQMIRYQRVTHRANALMGGSWKKLIAVQKGSIAVLATAALGLFAYQKLIRASVRDYKVFEDELKKSLAIFGDLSDTMEGDLSDAAREVGTSFRLSAEDGARGLFFLKSAGFDAKQSIAALGTVATFAQAGLFDMGEATSLLTDAQSALGLKYDALIPRMEAMTRVSDVLVKANTLADATTREFALALTNHAANAMRELNIPMEEGVALLALFADRGIKGQRAGLAFANVLRDLQRSATQNASTFDQLGIAVFDAGGNIRHIADIFEDLERVLGPLSDEQKKLTLTMLGFQERSQKFIKAAMGGSEAIREFGTSLYEAGGISEEVAEKQMLSLQGRTELMHAAFKDARIEIGENVVPAIRDHLIPFLTLLAESMKENADGIGGLAARFIRGVTVMGNLAGQAGNTLDAVFTDDKLNNVAKHFLQLQLEYGYGLSDLNMAAGVLRERLKDLATEGSFKFASGLEFSDAAQIQQFAMDYVEALEGMNLDVEEKLLLFKDLLKQPDVPAPIVGWLKRQIKALETGLLQFDTGDASVLEGLYTEIQDSLGALDELFDEAAYQKHLDDMEEAYYSAGVSMASSFESVPERIDLSLKEAHNNLLQNTIDTSNFMDDIKLLASLGMDDLAQALWDGGLANAGLAREAVENLGLAASMEAIYDEAKFNAFFFAEAMTAIYAAGFASEAMVVFNRAAQFGAEIANRINMAFADNLRLVITMDGFQVDVTPGGGETETPIRYGDDGNIAFAHGGIVTGPTRALIGEAGYAEAVIPLNSSGVDVLSSSMMKAMENLGGSLSGMSGGGDNINISLPPSASANQVIDAVRLDRMRKRSSGVY